MAIWVIIAVSVVVSALLSLLAIGFINVWLRRRRRNVRLERAVPAKKKSAETTKKVIWVCLGNGFAWVWCSYVLAYLDKVQIAESLSQVAVTEIIGVVLAYCVKSAVENLSKNNNWPDKGASKPTDSEQ